MQQSWMFLFSGILRLLILFPVLGLDKSGSILYTNIKLSVNYTDLAILHIYMFITPLLTNKANKLFNIKCQIDNVKRSEQEVSSCLFIIEQIRR